MADALATAVAVGGDEALAVVAGIGGYAAYLIRPDGSECATAGFAFVSWPPPPGADAGPEAHAGDRNHTRPPGQSFVIRGPILPGMIRDGLWLC